MGTGDPRKRSSVQPGRARAPPLLREGALRQRQVHPQRAGGGRGGHAGQSGARPASPTSRLGPLDSAVTVRTAPAFPPSATPTARDAYTAVVTATLGGRSWSPRSRPRSLPRRSWAWRSPTWTGLVTAAPTTTTRRCAAARINLAKPRPGDPPRPMAPCTRGAACASARRPR